MGKVLTLILIIILSVETVEGYLFLSEKITAGQKQIEEGLREIARGEPELRNGKARLKAGKQELSAGKKEYAHAKSNIFLVLVDKLLEDGKGFKEAGDRISEGEMQIAKGESEVDLGNKRVDAGRLELFRGMEKLRLARQARTACVFGTFVFGSALIVLGFLWRRSLARSYKEALNFRMRRIDARG